MKENANRRCGTCRFWFCNNEMIPEEDLPRIAGECGNEHRPSLGDFRLPHHGTKCDGWALKTS